MWIFVFPFVSAGKSRASIHPSRRRTKCCPSPCNFTEVSHWNGRNPITPLCSVAHSNGIALFASRRFFSEDILRTEQPPSRLLSPDLLVGSVANFLGVGVPSPHSSEPELKRYEVAGRNVGGEFDVGADPSQATTTASNSDLFGAPSSVAPSSTISDLFPTASSTQGSSLSGSGANIYYLVVSVFHFHWLLLRPESVPLP